MRYANRNHEYKVAPPFDPSGNTALVGASLMFDILCLVADSLSTRLASELPSE